MAKEQSVNNLPYWDEQFDNLFYIPDVKIVTYEELMTFLQPSQVVAAKTWWNSNLPMDKFLPLVTPTSGDISIDLNNFAERIKQRSEGLTCPKPSVVKLKSGIVLLDKNNFELIGIVYNHPSGLENELKMFIYKNKEEFSCPAEVSFIENEVITRNPNILYWDTLEKKYV